MSPQHRTGKGAPPAGLPYTGCRTDCRRPVAVHRVAVHGIAVDRIPVHRDCRTPGSRTPGSVHRVAVDRIPHGVAVHRVPVDGIGAHEPRPRVGEEHVVHLGLDPGPLEATHRAQRVPDGAPPVPAGDTSLVQARLVALVVARRQPPQQGPDPLRVGRRLDQHGVRGVGERVLAVGQPHPRRPVQRSQIRFGALRRGRRPSASRSLFHWCPLVSEPVRVGGGGPDILPNCHSPSQSPTVRSPAGSSRAPGTAAGRTAAGGPTPRQPSLALDAASGPRRRARHRRDRQPGPLGAGLGAARARRADEAVTEFHAIDLPSATTSCRSRGRARAKPRHLPLAAGSVTGARRRAGRAQAVCARLGGRGGAPDQPRAAHRPPRPGPRALRRGAASSSPPATGPAAVVHLNPGRPPQLAATAAAAAIWRRPSRSPTRRTCLLKAMAAHNPQVLKRRQGTWPTPSSPRPGWEERHRRLPSTRASSRSSTPTGPEVMLAGWAQGGRPGRGGSGPSTDCGRRTTWPISTRPVCCWPGPACLRGRR